MARVEQLFEHRFPSGLDWRVAQFGLHVSVVAEHLGLELQVWEEDGLGDVTGLFLRLPSGRLLLLREFHHSLHGLYPPSFEACADGHDVAMHGAPEIVEDMLPVCGLSRAEITWIGDEESRQTAIGLLDRWRCRLSE
ncbi:hypothetical protein [Inquilinus sp. Marseille-Q2685]|uniref:hypothetical protein n=1 Tax=Inquilinus sp. Marseille-Q2685 TaxID=2866581 RepID=UPI001CE441F4|nr:hypothetical protein [Inquilinus sp. Marseille-Q2685]